MVQNRQALLLILSIPEGSQHIFFNFTKDLKPLVALRLIVRGFMFCELLMAHTPQQNSHVLGIGVLNFFDRKVVGDSVGHQDFVEILLGFAHKVVCHRVVTFPNLVGVLREVNRVLNLSFLKEYGGLITYHKEDLNVAQVELPVVVEDGLELVKSNFEEVLVLHGVETVVDDVDVQL
jgi:hypothetical protein